MKRKLLFAMVALLSIVGVKQANAYTTDDLESAGWTLVTDANITGVDNNYYVLVDAYSSAYVMANDASHFRPCYKTLGNPIENPSFVWCLEGSGNTLSLKSVSTGAYFKQASGWNTSMGYSRDSRNVVTCTFTLNSGKYDLKCVQSNAMVGHWNDGTAGVAEDGENIAANKSTEHADGFKLYAMPKSDYIQALAAARATAVAGATKASPVEATSWMQNPDFSNDWGGWELSFTSSGNMQWGQKTLESWNATNVIVKQEFSGVPNGKYKVQADLISGPGATHAAYVYATGDSKVSSDVVSVDASAGNYTTMSNEVAGNTLTADNVNVTGNTITVGFDQSTGWIVADNFKLYYYGPNLAASDALPVGDMEAGKWYYFDIAVGGDYNLSCTNLSDIVYSTDGSILLEDAGSISTTFDASPAELTAGRYYVKSSSAQTLTVEASSYSYVVSDASTNITYIQPGNVVTVSYTVSTNDPGATLDQDYSGVTFDDAAINVIPGISGFSFTVPADLEAGVEHTLYIPAGAIGYDEGSTYNAEQSITLNAVAIYDGVYYMYNTDTQNYISRSGNYATQAILDNWGLAFNVSTDANNNTKLQYFDSQLWLGDDGFCYGDCSGSRVRSFNVTKVAGGYKFLNTNNNKYLAVNDNKTVADAEEGGNLQGTSNIWYLESTTEHKDNYTANEDAQAASVATAVGIVGVTTKAQLIDILAANYGETDINITGAKAEKFQQYAGSSQALSENTYYSETVNGLKAGIYKLSVGAFQRAAGNERVAAADGARSLIYLYAGANKTQIKSVMDYGATTAYASDFEYEGKHYPNNEASAYAAIETGNYQNDVYVYLAEAGSLEIGIKNPTRLGGDFATWAAYENWTLTYYEAKATPAEKEALADAIATAEAKTLGFETSEYAPYNNVDALTALATAKAIDPDNASGAAVVAATTALTGATWTANVGEVNAFAYGDFDTYETISGEDMPYGWNLYNGESNHSRIMGGTQGSDNPGLAASSSGKALLLKWNSTYGESEGYTMPLKASTLYKITFIYCGWGGNTPQTHVVMTDPSGNEITLNPVFRPATGDGQADATHWYTFTGYFVSSTAGNYKFNLNKVESGQQQIAIADIELKTSDDALEFADDAVPTYAPGTYPSVKVTRTLTANRWATAVYPFAVDATSAGVTVATLESFDEGELSFSSTAGTSVANEPFMMRSASDKASFTLTDVEVDATAAEPEKTAGDAAFKGTYTGTTVEGEGTLYNYVLSNNNIYKVAAESATINPYRAYFAITAAAGAKSLTFVVDGKATGVEAPAIAETEEPEVLFNVAGVQVGKDYKGVVINQKGEKRLQ